VCTLSLFKRNGHETSYNGVTQYLFNELSDEGSKRMSTSATLAMAADN
jgi:hypothetical protein